MRVENAFSLVFLLLAISLDRVRGGEFGYFQTPPDAGALDDFSLNPTYRLGDVVNLEWTVNYNITSLVLWQDEQIAPIYDIEPVYLYLNMTNPGTFPWTVSLAYPDKTFDIDPRPEDGIPGPVFFFAVLNGSDPQLVNYTTSHYFNISTNATSTSTISSAAARTTSAATSSTSTTLSTASSPATNTASVNAIPQVSATPAPSSGLSSGAAAGIGVGVGLFGLLLGAALACLFLKRRRGHGPMGAGPPAPPPPVSGPYWNTQHQATAYSDGSYRTPWGHAAPVEVPSETVGRK